MRCLATSWLVDSTVGLRATDNAPECHGPTSHGSVLSNRPQRVFRAGRLVDACFAKSYRCIASINPDKLLTRANQGVGT